jgi:hypothetical protein
VHFLVFLFSVTENNEVTVTESPQAPNSLKGKPLQSGYDSHYVIVDISGMPVVSTNNKKAYDEIVIGQESQVLPAFGSFNNM